MKTVNVRAWGELQPAFADADGRVWVYDDVAGHYTTCHSLRPGQVRYVRALATVARSK